MLLALIYSVFRLVLDALIDRRRSDANLRLELLVLRHQLRVLERQVNPVRCTYQSAGTRACAVEEPGSVVPGAISCRGDDLRRSR